MDDLMDIAATLRDNWEAVLVACLVFAVGLLVSRLACDCLYSVTHCIVAPGVLVCRS